MNKKSSLTEIREQNGYDPETIADLLGISSSELKGYEENPGQLPVTIAVKLSMIYRSGIDSIRFGGSDFTHNSPTKL